LSVYCNSLKKKNPIKSLKNKFGLGKPNSNSNNANSPQIRNDISTCVDKGMGFNGFGLRDIPKLVAKFTGLDSKQEFTKYVEPILNKTVGLAENAFNFAIGDFTGEELARKAICCAM
jgi:hypothetical protein